MRFAILSRDPTLYSTYRLREAARQRGHDVQVIDHLRCIMRAGAAGLRLEIDGSVPRSFDAAIPRIGTSVSLYGIALARHFEGMGTRCVNCADAIALAHDKVATLQRVAAAGGPVPETAFGYGGYDAERMIELTGASPTVIKLLCGTQGTGVILVENDKSAASIVQAFRSKFIDVLVQRFVEEARGVDFRAIVIGGEVVASMRREGAPGEFRSNLHRGGQGSKVKLTADEKECAVKAAASVGLEVAGVDLIRSDDGPLVLELNASPGLEGVEEVTGVDVADAWIEYLESQVQPR